MQFVALLSLLLQAHYYYYSTGTGASDLLISKQLNRVIIVLEQKPSPWQRMRLWVMLHDIVTDYNNIIIMMMEYYYYEPKMELIDSLYLI